MKPAFLTILILLLLSASVTSAQTDTTCGGVERWKIKVLADPDTASINWLPVESSVHEQAALPTVNPKQSDPRLPSEKQVYRVMALLLQYKLEDDGDIHLVLRDPDSSISMIAEIPDPDCPLVQTTSRADLYWTARQWITNNIGRPTTSWKVLSPPPLVSILGVGFYDFPHSQVGRALNNREIHSVLAIGSGMNSVADNWTFLHGGISLNPNPAQDRLHCSIVVDAPEEIQLVRIVDEGGREKFKLVPDRPLHDLMSDLPISNLPNGAYHVQCLTTTGMLAKKFLINR